MVYSKIKKILFILLCVFIILFPFWCVRGLCSEETEETVGVTNVSNLSISPDRNYFSSISNVNVAYFELEKGYVYTIYNSHNLSRYLAVSNEIPANNVTYDYIGIIEPGSSYSYVANNNNYLYLGYSSNLNVTVTRKPIDNIDTTIDTLTNVISLSSIWSIFDNSINFVYIAIIFAFGFGLVTLLVKKISKGSE